MRCAGIHGPRHEQKGHGRDRGHHVEVVNLSTSTSGASTGLFRHGRPFMVRGLRHAHAFRCAGSGIIPGMASFTPTRRMLPDSPRSPPPCACSNRSAYHRCSPAPRSVRSYNQAARPGDRRPGVFHAGVPTTRRAGPALPLGFHYHLTPNAVSVGLMGMSVMPQVGESDRSLMLRPTLSRGWA